jgi:hypothetical protein
MVDPNFLSYKATIPIGRWNTLKSDTEIVGTGTHVTNKHERYKY